jgi:hypothetical protein
MNASELNARARYLQAVQASLDAVPALSSDDRAEVLAEILPMVARRLSIAQGSGKMTCPVLALPCSVHGFLHGAEAEELRCGVEQLLRESASGPGDAQHDLAELRLGLQLLLDHVNARDSLAYLEARDRETQNTPCEAQPDSQPCSWTRIGSARTQSEVPPTAPVVQCLNCQATFVWWLAPVQLCDACVAADC